MRILVIGATGRSGRAVCDALLDRGHRVTAFARSATAMTPTAIVSIASTATPPMPRASSASCPDTTPSS